MLAKTIEDIKQLSIAERILLVEEIWDSIAATTEELSVTEAQKKELDIRLAAYKKQPNQRASWLVVKKRVESNKFAENKK